MIHLTYQQAEEVARKFNFKVIQFGVANSVGNFPSAALLRFAYINDQADVLISVEITNYSTEDNPNGHNKISTEPFDPGKGFSKRGEVVSLEIHISINSTWHLKTATVLEAGEVTHQKFVDALLIALRPFMIIRNMSNDLLSMFSDNAQLVEPPKPKKSVK